MPPRTLPNRGAATPAQPTQNYQQPPASPPQRAHGGAAQAGGPARGGRGLPPPPTGWTPPAHGDGGGFTRRTDKEWDEDHPLRDGEHELDAYVTKVVAWNAGGVTVTFRVSQWDRDANRSGPHHGRPLRFDQQPRRSLAERLRDPADEKAARQYGNWRHDIVTAYTDCGFPEESWQRDDVGPVPPWDRFFVQQVGGLVIPVMLRVKVRAWSMKSETRYVHDRAFHGLDVKSITVVRDGGGRPFQAMLPREVPPGVAQMHRWRVAEERTIGDGLATVAVLDKESVPFPHNNLPTYKDL